MSDTQTSLSAVPLIQHARLLLSDARTAFKDLPNWEKPIHVFWLLGPFILLIERTPADFWLSLLSVIFVVRALWQRDASWLRHLWVRAAFTFWAVCLLSAGLSMAPSYALGEAFSWFRFPLFAMATVFWLGKDKRLIYLMLLSTGVGMMTMTTILFAEVFFEGFKDGRLVWPYGDAVPGNYLAKVTMPALLVCTTLAARGKFSIAFIAATVLGISLAASMLSGERMNLILRIFSGGLAFTITLRRAQNLVLMFFVFAFSVILVLLLSPDFYRLLTQFFERLPTSSTSDYFRVSYGAWIVFTDNAIFGIGTGNYRDLCSQFTEGVINFRCDNHPHNYYVQLLAETGILGFVTGVFMICTIIWMLFRAGRTNRQNIVAVTAFIVPLGLFFPIQSTADFFGQWNNIFMWSAVALSMASVNFLPTQNQTQK